MFALLQQQLGNAFVQDVVRSAGNATTAERSPFEPLPPGLRGELESATGMPLGHVEIDAGPTGAEVAAGHSARAVAIGNKIYMGEGQYDPETVAGRALIAHEVAHVVQSTAGSSAHRSVENGDERGEASAELEADGFGARFAREGGAMSWRPTYGVGQCQPMRDSLKVNPEPQHRSTVQAIDGNHPAAKDADGQTVVQAQTSTGRGKALPLTYKDWKALATVAETVTVQDDLGDKLTMEITYRIENRPADVGDVPDMWIHTERKALLTVDSGEHAGATIVGQARIELGINEPLDPRAAIGHASIGPNHSAQIYLAEAAQFVNEFGPGGKASLREDAAGNDLFAYDDPLRTLVALKNVLKKQHVAHHGVDVAAMAKQAREFIAAAKQAETFLGKEIEGIRTHHARHPGMVAPAKFLAWDMADWLARNRQQGRDDTENARQVRAAQQDLLRMIETAETVHAPDNDGVEDILGAPVRLVGRTLSGLKEVGAMGIDALVLGIDALGQRTGLWSFDYSPLSHYGQWVDQTNAGPKAGAVAIVNGFADQWSEALERARNGDYSALMDVGIDSALMLDGAASAGVKVADQAPAIIAKFEGIAKGAAALASRGSAEAGDVAAAMADAAKAFLEKQHAAGMQMAGAGGGGGPKIGAPSLDPIVEGFDAAKKAFASTRASRAKDRAIAAVKTRLGSEKAPDVAEWATRVEVVLGDTKAVKRFFDGLGTRVSDPGPFMRSVEAVLGSRNIAADDLAEVLGNILDTKIADPVAVLSEIEWISTKTLSSGARSMLIRRAAKGEVDLDWVRRTSLSDGELEILGQDRYTSWKEFEQASDIPARRTPGALADRPPPNNAKGANSKLRGVAAELAAGDMELPAGLKIGHRIISNSADSSLDFELISSDGRPAELEVKGHRGENWKQELDEYDTETSAGKPPEAMKSQVGRLVKQVKAARDRGVKVYVAVTDATPIVARDRLVRILTLVGVPEDQLLFLSESEIKRVAKQLREHMGIPQPGVPKSAATGDE